MVERTAKKLSDGYAMVSSLDLTLGLHPSRRLSPGKWYSMLEFNGGQILCRILFMIVWRSIGGRPGFLLRVREVRKMADVGTGNGLKIGILEVSNHSRLGWRGCIYLEMCLEVK